MTKLLELEQAIEHLEPGELEKFRNWFYEFESRMWDEQIVKDEQEGKLENLAAEAMAEFKKGKAKPL